VYLKAIRLQNIKCFEDVTLRFPHRGGDYGGWNVILGENGRGKSTILRSTALGVLQPVLASFALGQQEGQFIRQDARGASTVSIDLVFHPTEFQATDGTDASYHRRLTFSANEEPQVHVQGSPRRFGEQPLLDAVCYGYRPFRRLEVSQTIPNFYFQFPKSLSRFVTLFTDEVGLADATRGLLDLHIASLDPVHTFHRGARQTLEAMRKVIDALLPGGVLLGTISSEKVRLKTAPGMEVAERELSDGYRSFLSLVFDLLRHLSARFGLTFSELIHEEGDSIYLDVGGVVLIDEADAHLHPSWQRELGERLRRVFPNIQFIVTTHSPFITQEATDGGLFVLRTGNNGVVSVEQPVESVRGWTASQILTSPLFGLESTRAPEMESLVHEQATLIARERAGTLTQTDRERLTTVQELLSATLSAPGETYDEMRRQQDMADYVDQTLNRLKSGQQ
jgi:predicted ATP-binding protein involved in virulence